MKRMQMNSADPARAIPVVFGAFLTLSVVVMAQSEPPDDGFGSSQPAAISVQDEDPPRGLFFAGPVPRTKFVADDATLTDVCSVGTNCWAVGERGVILRSEDAGQTWHTSVLPAECRLTSVCFLTNQIGFVAGSRYDAHDRRRRAVLLSTRDGGQSWTPLSDGPDSQDVEAGFRAAKDLPPLTFVRFFDLENAVAIGRSDSVGGAANIFRSRDRGRSWEALSSDTAAGWTSGAFLSPDDGFVFGHGLALGAVVSQKLVSLIRPQNSLRQIRSASVTQDGLGWLAGDGGFLQHSRDGGITWKPVPSALPQEMSDVIDLQAICHRGETVCAAGNPGSLVLQSSDGGISWQARRLPQSVPVNAMCFVGESTILAVGPLGVIHRSPDSGETWAATRNADYRAAVLCLTTDATDISFRMLSAIGGDEGFRIVVAQPSARTSRPGVDDILTADRMASAVPQAGANVFTQDWMFSRTQPLQSSVARELMKTWDLQSDGRVGQLLPQRIAALIRTWRPDVICIERSSHNDQVAAIWIQALDAAMNISAGTDRRSRVLDSVGLAPWTVKRVVTREPDRRTTPLSFSGESLLKNLGTLSGLVAEHCRHQIVDSTDAHQATTDSYSVHNNRDVAAVPHLLAGMMVAPGTASRRMLTPASPELLNELKRLTRQAHQQRAVLANQAQRTDAPLNLIAQLSTIGSQLPDRLAMRQLLSLSSMYESVENLDGQIAVLKEIVGRFPDSPEATDANAQLFQYYSSAELRFLRRAATQSPVKAGNSGAPTQNPIIQQISSGTIPGIARPLVTNAGTGTALPSPVGSDSSAITARWDANADAALTNLHRLSLERATSPEFLLRHAANLRLRGDENRSSSALSLAGGKSGPFAILAQAEMQATFGAATSPVPVINLKKSESKPFLDATLSDAIWEDADEIPLAIVGEPGSSGNPGCLIMLAWDEDHVYLSGRVERVPDHDYAMDKTIDRRHDTVHGIRDRVEISFDTDRDYTTAFQFTIDESGQTSERCWKSRRWNPDWFVAADMDEQAWRFEIAIPQEALVSQPLKPGNLWAVRIHRIVPGILQQSLKADESTTERESVAGHGLLRFIRRLN